MASTLLGLLLFVLVCGALAERLYSPDNSFDWNYAIAFGGNRVSFLDQGREVLLSMDKSSGSGFGSKLEYGSGFFHMNIKVPARDSAGIVTAFYLSSPQNDHEELDFEFLGNREGKPYILQTNVFANGHGNREQRFHLWFDPTSSFHTYSILWNSYQIVFFVDNTPIRVFKNLQNIGVDYPSQPMQILATLWNGEDWATDGGKAKIDWRYAPFKAQFQGFDVDGCPSNKVKNPLCSSSRLWWNSRKYQRLSVSQEKLLLQVKKHYMTYDYCTDKTRKVLTPQECSQ